MTPASNPFTPLYTSLRRFLRRASLGLFLAGFGFYSLSFFTAPEVTTPLLFLLSCSIILAVSYPKSLHPYHAASLFFSTSLLALPLPVFAFSLPLGLLALLVCIGLALVTRLGARFVLDTRMTQHYQSLLHTSLHLLLDRVPSCPPGTLTLSQHHTPTLTFRPEPPLAPSFDLTQQVYHIQVRLGRANPFSDLPYPTTSLAFSGSAHDRITYSTPAP
jgi:hypothetical protein